MQNSLTRQSSTPSAGAHPSAALSGGSNAAPVRSVCNGGNPSRLGGVPTYVFVSMTLLPAARGDVATYPSAVPMATLSEEKMKRTYSAARARQSTSAYVGGTRGRSPMFPMGSCTTVPCAPANPSAVATQQQTSTWRTMLVPTLVIRYYRCARYGMNAASGTEAVSAVTWPGCMGSWVHGE
jgi:hypothetical protein